MKISHMGFPRMDKKVNICDSRINAIICLQDKVRFVFYDGFDILTCDGYVPVTRGFIDILDCNSDEFFCRLIHREITPQGAIEHGYPISLLELSSIMEMKNRTLEVFLELYDYNYLYWRGTLLPHLSDGLSENVVIETSGVFRVEYSWENDDPLVNFIL